MIENLPIKIGIYTSGLYRLMSSAIDKAFKEKGIPLSLEQFRIMMILKNCGEKSLAEIVKIVDRDSAAMTRSIKSLEEKGFIIRTAIATDKRHKNLIITEAGQIALVDIIAVEQAVAALVIRDFSNEEAELFEQLLVKAKNNLLNEHQNQTNEK